MLAPRRRGAGSRRPISMLTEAWSLHQWAELTGNDPDDAQEVAMSHNPSTTDPLVARMPFRNQGTSRLAAALGQRAKAALHHWQRHRMNRALQQLDDRTLDDIGLARNEIRGLVDELIGPPPRLALQGQNGRSSVRRESAQEESPTPASRHVQTNDVEKPGPVWDVYQSWRDL